MGEGWRKCCNEANGGEGGACIPVSRWDGSEKPLETVHMLPASVTNVAKERFFWFKELWYTWHWVSSGGWLLWGVCGGDTDAGGRKWD